MAQYDTFAPEPRWTDRKRAVLELLARGRTNAEIAESLGLTLAGAKWHVSEVLSILGVESREEAAEYWRREQSLAHRVSRGMRALSATLFSWKVAGGATGLAAMAGGAIVVGSLSADGVSGGTQLTNAAGDVPTATTATHVWGTLADIEFAPVITVQLADGNTVTLLASLGSDFMIRPEHSSEGFDNVYRSHGTKVDFEPSVFMGFGNQRVGLFYGSTSLDSDHVELSLYDGRTIEVPLVDFPAEFGMPGRFWAFEFDPRSLVGEMRSVAKDGTVLDRETIFQPPGSMPPLGQTRSGPLSDLILVGSGRDDPWSGTIPFSGGRVGNIAHPAGGLYRFSVEHDGTRPLVLHFWCQTGVVPLTWESGPDSAGNGVIVANVPPKSAGCSFIVFGGDGTHRISAISGP